MKEVQEALAVQNLKTVAQAKKRQVRIPSPAASYLYPTSTPHLPHIQQEVIKLKKMNKHQDNVSVSLFVFT